MCMCCAGGIPGDEETNKAAVLVDFGAAYVLVYLAGSWRHSIMVRSMELVRRHRSLRFLGNDSLGHLRASQPATRWWLSTATSAGEVVPPGGAVLPDVLQAEDRGWGGVGGLQAMLCSQSSWPISRASRLAIMRHPPALNLGLGAYFAMVAARARAVPSLEAAAASAAWRSSSRISHTRPYLHAWGRHGGMDSSTPVGSDRWTPPYLSWEALASSSSTSQPEEGGAD